jgi:Protein of unknown function (DUF2690)
MKRIRHRLTVTIAALSIAVSGVLAIEGSPASAASYDGTDPYQTGCASGAYPVSYSHLWFNFGNSPLGARDANALIQLFYSPSCRTVWAVLTGALYAPPAPSNSGGYANIISNFDFQSYSCTANFNGDCYTAQLNDAGVTSYAQASDTLGDNGPMYFGQTRSY